MSKRLDKIGGLTFEELQHLSEDDPEEFEKHRERTIAAAILKARPKFRKRMRKLIKTYDNLTKGKNPEDSLNVAVMMLDKSMLDLSSFVELFTRKIISTFGKKV